MEESKYFHEAVFEVRDSVESELFSLILASDWGLFRTQQVQSVN